jgi:hypothetical protein
VSFRTEREIRIWATADCVPEQFMEENIYVRRTIKYSAIACSRVARSA